MSQTSNDSALVVQDEATSNNLQAHSAQSVVARRSAPPRRKASDEIARLIRSLSAGNFIDRAQLDGFPGSDKSTLSQVNILIETLAASITPLVARVDRMAACEISGLNGEFASGAFSQVHHGLSSCLDNVARFAEDAKRVARDQARGDESARNELRGLPRGFSRTLEDH